MNGLYFLKEPIWEEKSHLLWRLSLSIQLLPKYVMDLPPGCAVHGSAAAPRAECGHSAITQPPRPDDVLPRHLGVVSGLWHQQASTHTHTHMFIITYIHTLTQYPQQTLTVLLSPLSMFLTPVPSLLRQFSHYYYPRHTHVRTHSHAHAC